MVKASIKYIFKKINLNLACLVKLGLFGQVGKSSINQDLVQVNVLFSRSIAKKQAHLV